MKIKKSVLAAILLMGVAAGLHLVRFIADLPLVMGTFQFPRWLSGAVVVLIAGIVYYIFTEKE